ncbi:MAG: alpha/beta hydrolase [Bacteroidetes bacterium]|nr:alpha/beta hydrolase [Bacteroidota bacterium]MDA0888444.1 alpha/beta hydrolase [Bacteroidota bacterium]MDA1084504.1 alpha/beta hydrolase [Bacteroidota bacterium]
MKKKNKHKQGFSVPTWLRLIFRNLERISPYLAMKAAAYVFSKPLKFKVPLKEQQALKDCIQKMEYIKSIDRNVALFTWENSGGKVLLTHGWSGRGMQLYYIAECLHKEGYHVVTYDAPAHGKSEGKLTNMIQMIETIAHLDKGENGFDHFIGHSFGAMAIFNYCKIGSSAKKIVTIGAADNMRTIFDSFVSSVGLSTKMLKRMTTYFEEKYEVNIDDFSPFVAAQKIQTPTLLIHDEEDYDVHVNCSETIAKHHPNAKVIKTKGLGHRRILRDNMVMQHIKSFIQES